MEFPTEDYGFFEKDQFATSTPKKDPGEIGVELLAQIRNTGRILDHHRLVIGGTKLQTVLVPLTKMYDLPALTGWKFKFQFWPRDATIRRNMCTSVWVDVASILTSREAVAVDNDNGQIPQEAVIGEITKAEAQAAIRWAVVVGEDSKMRLNLQLLPATADTLAGKPLLRG
jgi:hypothetical protein